MIITVKNLQQQTFTVDFDSQNTVFQLKEKIYIERGPDYIIEKQKLIYAGVILDNERTIASYNVDEKKFVVLMVKRDIRTYVQQHDEQCSPPSTSTTVTTSSADIVKGKPKVLQTALVKKQGNFKSGTSGGSDEDVKSATSGKSDGSIEPVRSCSSIISTEAGSSSQSGGSETSHTTFSSGDLAGVFPNSSLLSRGESHLLMGQEYNRTVEAIIEMGYSRGMVECAMAASFNNAERAVEYLISGIPEAIHSFNATGAARESALMRNLNLSTEHAAESNDAGSIGSRGLLRSDAEGGDIFTNQVGSIDDNTIEQQSNREDPFEFLRNQPQFLQMRSLVYQNPDLLHAVLQQIGQTNPALLQLISENQDAFLSMLNQPLDVPTGTRVNHVRRMTEIRRTQISAARRAAGGGDGLHIRSLDTTSGADGDGRFQQQRPGESGDAGDDIMPYEMLQSRPDRAAESRVAVADAFLQERAALSTSVERDAIGMDDASDNTFSANLSAPNIGIGSGSAINIRLTQQDKDTIERLKDLGFPESLVLQVYFACERDEHLAANFLLTSAFDE